LTTSPTDLSWIEPRYALGWKIILVPQSINVGKMSLYFDKTTVAVGSRVQSRHYRDRAFSITASTAFQHSPAIQQSSNPAIQQSAISNQQSAIAINSNRGQDTD
jgi:hypothetical protein